MLIITIIITAAACLSALFGWKDHQELRAVRAALDVVKTQRDEAIEAGKTAYAQGNADGRQLEREQIERERVIATRKRAIVAGDARARLN